MEHLHGINILHIFHLNNTKSVQANNTRPTSNTYISLLNSTLKTRPKIIDVCTSAVVVVISCIMRKKVMPKCLGYIFWNSKVDNIIILHLLRLSLSFFCNSTKYHKLMYTENELGIIEFSFFIQMFISLLGNKRIVINRKLDLFHPVSIRRRVAFNTYVKI